MAKGINDLQSALAQVEFDSGNPLFDAIVYLVGKGIGLGGDIQKLELLHQNLVEIAKREPNGFFRRAAGGQLVPVSFD